MRYMLCRVVVMLVGKQAGEFAAALQAGQPEPPRGCLPVQGGPNRSPKHCCSLCTALCLPEAAEATPTSSAVTSEKQLQIFAGFGQVQVVRVHCQLSLGSSPVGLVCIHTLQYDIWEMQTCGEDAAGVQFVTLVEEADGD